MKIDIYRPCKRAHKPRIKIHEWDIWSMDHTLALIILPMLVKLKLQRHGVPGCFFPLSEEALGAEREENWRRAEEEWDKVLDKMIWAMEQIAYSREPSPWRKRKGETRKKMMEKVDGHIFQNLPYSEKEEKDYEEWSKRNREINARIQEGCELLGKHFRDLWD